MTDLVKRLRDYISREARYGSEAALDPDYVAAAADRIEALEAALRDFPGFTDDCAIGDPWIERVRALLSNGKKAATPKDGGEVRDII